MPKSQQERNTSNPLGQKINALMREKGIAGDYAAIARAFDVKTPSVYDWVDHGRLGKERYLALVKWSGRSLDWWFDIPSSCIARDEPSTSQPSHPLIASENVKNASLVKATRGKSPFERISAAEWQALPHEAIREIESFAMGLIAGQRLAADAKSQNGSGW